MGRSALIPWPILALGQCQSSMLWGRFCRVRMLTCGTYNGNGTCNGTRGCELCCNTQPSIQCLCGKKLTGNFGLNRVKLDCKSKRWWHMFLAKNQKGIGFIKLHHVHSSVVFTSLISRRLNFNIHQYFQGLSYHFFTEGGGHLFPGGVGQIF